MLSINSKKCSIVQLILSLSLAVICLSACATGRSKQLVCPPLIDYTHQQENLADVEIHNLPPDHILHQMMIDYGQLRDIIRECNDGKKVTLP